jgi:hypothetical protein
VIEDACTSRTHDHIISPDAHGVAENNFDIDSVLDIIRMPGAQNVDVAGALGGISMYRGYNHI